MSSIADTWPAAPGGALDDLDRRWGRLYDLATIGRRWIAQRLDNGHVLTAATPAALDRLIAADHAARPVQPDQ